MTTVGYSSFGGIEITVVRPVYPRPEQEQDEARPVFRFTRSEWALMVGSGLWGAISQCGWRVWDDVTAHRVPQVQEKDHLLLVANLFLQGFEIDFTGMARIPACPTPLAYSALSLLSAAAALWRSQNPPEPTSRACPPPSGPMFHQEIQPRPWAWAPPREPQVEQSVEGSHVETLVDLAKHGEEATFKDLAQTVGVRRELLDELWKGTVARLKRGDRIEAPPRNHPADNEGDA